MSTNLDFKGMIEANYNVLSNLEANIQAFFKTFENVDTKIVEKETAFINAKQEFKTLIEDYKSTLDKIREDFNLAVAKEQKEFIEVVNTNTNKILEIKKEELKQKLEVEEHNIILKAKNLLEAMKNFEDNINSKIADTIKNLPVELENQKDLYINKTLEAIKDTSKTLKMDIEDYRKVLDEELMKYKDTVIVQVNTCKDSLKSSTEAIKEVAEDIKKENITLNKSRSNLETDYKKINNNLEVVNRNIEVVNRNIEVVNRNTTNLINSISNINYTFIINKIYILLFSLLNTIFIFRIIVPTDYRFNFKSKFTLWILIIIGVLLVFLIIGDIINYFLNMLASEEEKEE